MGLLWTEYLCPPQIQMLKTNPQGDGTRRAFGRWLGHEAGAPLNGVSALMKGP